MLKLAVVILNWNGRAFLERFLPSVVAHCPDYAGVFVADNGSTDDSIAFLYDKYPDIGIIDLKRNYGYTGGYNRSMGQIEADYYVLLNSDIEVTEGWIEPVVQLMENHPDIAACQPKILSYEKPDHFEYAGASGGFIDKYGYPFCRGRIFEVLEEDVGQYDNPVDVFWATGACMFVRAKDFLKAGMLDEDFFAHMEEIDLCWRLKRMGKRILCLPHSRVYHVGGGTLPKNNPRKTFLNFRNNLLLLAMNLPAGVFYPVLIKRIMLDQVAALKFLLGGNARDFAAVYRALFSVFINMRRKRTQGKKLPYIPVGEVYQGSIVKEYFLKRRNKFSLLKKELFGRM